MEIKEVLKRIILVCFIFILSVNYVSAETGGIAEVDGASVHEKTDYSIVNNNETIPKIKSGNDLITDRLELILSSFYSSLDEGKMDTKSKIDAIYKLYSKISAIKSREGIDLNDVQLVIFNYIENSFELRISYYSLVLSDEEKARISKENYTFHIKTPKNVKSLYYTAYAAGNKKKKSNLMSLVKNTEINSVTIDIKDVSGYVSFKMDNDKFDKIKPTSNNRISDVKTLIKELHDKNIYVIGRVVVFKDKLLAVKRTDLAIKWSDGINVWYDYAGNKYMDPYSKEVWDYNANIAKVAYEIGFDEINFDYVRFPSDGKISSTYYPFANKIIKANRTWGKIIVLDKFSTYFTKTIREKYPDIVLSADVFGLVTRIDLMQIGQNLESFMLNFDYVGPMVYPSHYGRSFLGLSPADNYPYEIIKDALKHSSNKIDKLNKEIVLAKEENRQININGNFTAGVDVSTVDEISKTVIRPWLQGFTCTRCPGATPYNRYKFRRQIKAINEFDTDSWWVWNSGSNYYGSWYNK